ncbi:ABC transporter permease subunit [Synechococcus sp. CBW1002]|uniref:ABC transporter permease subunit n=1 Tax=Synechococcus sp. CBW1002 TaxID=1353134 RepID=UPI001E37376A|nr:ABC transporter permease subunit [Synechococcus sp. CBW1002]
MTSIEPKRRMWCRLRQRLWPLRSLRLQRLLALVVLSLVLALGAVGLHPAAAGPEGGADAATAKPTWTVGTDPTYAPFQMKAGAHDELQGFDIDLIQAIGKNSGHPIRFVSLPFDGLIPALQGGSVDMVISAMTITAERAQAVDFSRPYFVAGLGILVREGNTTIHNLKDLEGRTIAVQIGTTGAKAMAEVPGARVTTFDAAPLALQELINGNVEAYVNDLPATLHAIQAAGLRGLRVAGTPLTNEFYGIAFPRNSPLRDTVDHGIERMLADGSYARLYQRWFGQSPPELPEQAPALAEARREAALNPAQLLRNLMRGAGVTLSLTLVSFSFGLIGAGLVAYGLMGGGPLLRGLCRVYVDLFRGTPMLVQLFMIYFGLPALLNGLGLPFNLDRFVAAVIALSLNVAAYLSETLRAGIESIDPGQWEAADALAMNPIARMRFVVLPQALRRVLPPLANEFITLIKDTSLAAVIGFDELFREGQLVVATTYRAFEVYLAVALVYLVMTSVTSWLFKRVEHRLNPQRHAMAT